MAPQVVTVRSRSHPVLVELRRAARDGATYRRSGQVWIEGEHLCEAARRADAAVPQAVLDERAWEEPRLRELALSAGRVVLVAPELFASVSTLESPARIGFFIGLPVAQPPQPGMATVVLDRLQDAGNVGSILRSAAAFGFAQVLALKGTVALWSPKVLRAAMGAHFGLRLHEGAAPAELDALALPLVATSSHAAAALHEADLPSPCGWLFGHEGQGLDAQLTARCALEVRVPQPGGEESLNVAAAAAVCLYESVRRRGG